MDAVAAAKFLVNSGACDIIAIARHHAPAPRRFLGTGRRQDRSIQIDSF
jgi:hypothetical protein